MKVFSVTLKAAFYVLAEDGEDALRVAGDIYPLSNIEIELPRQAEPSYDVYEIRAQDDYHRKLCVNFESKIEGKS